MSVSVTCKATSVLPLSRSPNSPDCFAAFAKSEPAFANATTFAAEFAACTR